MRSLFFSSFALLIRDYRVRFRRTLLGFFWFFIPLFILVVSAMFLGKDIGLYSDQNSSSYLVELIAGLIFWQVVSEAWGEPLRLSRRANSIIRAVPFNYISLLMAGAFSAFFGLFIKLPVLITAMWLLGYQFHIGMLVLPFGFLSLVLLGVGLSCIFLPFSLGILDVRYALPLLSVICLICTPILYSMPSEGAIHWINSVSPFTYIVPPIRDFALGYDTSIYKLFAIFMANVIFLSLGLLFFNNKIQLSAAYVGR